MKNLSTGMDHRNQNGTWNYQAIHIKFTEKGKNSSLRVAKSYLSIPMINTAKASVSWNTDVS